MNKTEGKTEQYSAAAIQHWSPFLHDEAEAA